MRAALVGAGNVGTAVAYLLQQRGHEVVAVTSRTLESVVRASEWLQAEIYRVEDLPVADLILLGVPDGAIEEIAEAIAPRVTDGAFVCHFAGSFGPSILQKVVDVGASACAIHPVQACPSVDAGVARLPGSAWGVTCSDPGAEERIAGLIRDDLSGLPVQIPERIRPVWHAAAVTTSNGAAALLAAAESMLSAVGIDDPIEVLGPLAAGTIQNAREGGGGAATLTGPVVRREKQAIRRHVEALSEQGQQHADLYRAVAHLIIRSAIANGRIDHQAGMEMVEELE